MLLTNKYNSDFKKKKIVNMGCTDMDIDKVDSLLA